MKKLACAALFFIAVAAFAQEAPHTLTISGTGSVALPVERVSVTVGIWVVDTDVAKAFRTAIAKSRAVGAALRAHGVAASDLQTAAFSVSSVTDPDEKRDATPRFGVTTTISAMRDDANAAEELLSAAVDAGANRIEGVTFSAKETASARDRAFAAAFNDARARAEKLATAMGRTLGAVVSVVQGGSPLIESITKSAASIYAGESEVTVVLSVVFELK